MSAEPSDHARVWGMVCSDADVEAAQSALDALAAEEERLTVALGVAIRRAQARAEEHLTMCDPWQESCSRCGRLPAHPHIGGS